MPTAIGFPILHLERRIAPQATVGGQVDHAHATATNLLAGAVFNDALGKGLGHGANCLRPRICNTMAALTTEPPADVHLMPRTPVSTALGDDASNASHTRLHGADWAMSDQMLVRAVDAIIKRDSLLCVDFDVPYLAGYSRDGTTIYIDRDFRPMMTTSTGRVIDTRRFLFLHEAVEKAMLTAFGLRYQHAHQIALRIEQAAVRAEDLGWEEYDRFMQSQVKEADEDTSLKLPPDLDLTPYVDSRDTPILARMRAAMAGS